jgi:transposase
MQPQYTQAEFTGQHVYAGIDVALKNWKVAIFLDHTFHKRLSFPPDPVSVAQYLKRTFPGAQYHSVYEAGYFGFRPHEALVNHGVDNMVINPADVPSTDKERRTKNDPVDATKLARSLANGELRPIYIPEHIIQEDRALVRMRSTFVRKQTRCKNQIKAKLRYFNFPAPPEDIIEKYWSGAYIHWLGNISFEYESGRFAFHVLLKELASLRATITEITRQIRRLSLEERFCSRVQILITIPGISIMAAMIFLVEIVTLDRFKNLDRLASFVGLVPGEHSTGETEVDTGLIPRRNVALRYILIECAWIAVRQDPALLQAFNEYCKRMPKNVAIIHIARKLLSRMRFVLKHNQPYVTGVVSSR